jgi:hypothetical protein
MGEPFAGRDLVWLERRRAELFGLIAQVGDFRRGSLNAVWRKCGKPNCRCPAGAPRSRAAVESDPPDRRQDRECAPEAGPGAGQGAGRGGRAPAVRRLGGGGERRQRGDLHGPAGARSGGAPSGGGGKEGLTAQLAEIAAAEVGRLAALAAGLPGTGSGLGVLEQAMRTALATAGARLPEAVLAADGDGYAGPHAKCGAGHQASYAGRRPKTITTVLGPRRRALPPGCRPRRRRRLDLDHVQVKRQAKSVRETARSRFYPALCARRHCAADLPCRPRNGV